MSNQTTYPTDWIEGKPKGAIQIFKNKAYKVTISPPKQQQYAKYFYFNKYESKEDAYKQATLWRYNESKKLGTLTNKIRYINKNTIEVTLNDEKTFVTDSKFIDIIKKNKLCIKRKKTKDGSTYYVHYRGENKRTYPFHKLIGNFDHIKYFNGDTLDHRSCNITDTGAVEKIDIKYDNDDDQYKYFQMKYEDLPLNQWILGKPVGSVFQRKNEKVWTAIVTTKNKKYNKTFAFDDDTKEETYKKAKMWQINISYKTGSTKNLIRILDNNYIEVKIRDDYTMKTDFKFLKDIQKYYLYLTKSKNVNSEYYILISKNNKNIYFHKYITGFAMTDHIDRNPLNNCLENLRKTSYKLNNINSSMKITNTTGYTGIRFKVKDNAWESRFKINNKDYCKSFSAKKYGYYVARELAILGRINYCLKFNSRNGLDGMKNSWTNVRDVNTKTTIEEINNKIEDLYILIYDIIENTIYDINDISVLFWRRNCYFIGFVFKNLYSSFWFTLYPVSWICSLI